MKAKKYIKHLYLFLLVIAMQLPAQQTNTLYFLENAPTRHYLNPAFQPLTGFYFGIPVLGFTHIEAGNNSFTVGSIDLIDNKDKLFGLIRPTTLFKADAQVNLLNFGFRAKHSYFSFDVSQKVNAQFGIPKDLFRFGFYGTPELEGNKFNLATMNMGADVYTEFALGYSKYLNEKWTVGGKLKFLMGQANATANFSNFEINAGIDEWTLKTRGMINTSSAAIVTGDNLGNLDFATPNNEIDYVLPFSGFGGAIDLGATFKPIKNLTVSAAITDLGFIRWNRNAKNMVVESDFTFNGTGPLTAKQMFNDFDFEAIMDSVLSKLEDAVVTDITDKPYTSGVRPKLNIGAEYAFLNDKMSVGLLSRTIFQRKQIYQELTTSLNMRPISGFNASLSYSLVNGRWSNIGVGVGTRLWIFNAFAAADYVPLRYAKYTMDSSLPIIGNVLPIPYSKDRVNFTIGANIVFGYRQDKDRDGVQNRFDLCPETPRKVAVDKDGCPIDSDGDGVPDYLDKCPDTPIAARGMIDADGCPKDSDGDGVPDYLDKCPNTPAAARGFVDADGCPLDSDGDGVPDYLDKCPDTPKEAIGFVDANGCPLDSDGDGVPDYLDKCPDTPKEAYGMIDAHGCPIDSDGDGVPDYLDKCPDTPKEAIGFVDENGCPKDTDGDGIPDYLDKCPTVAGPKSNNGCPELTREVRTLFQKALQGIQFESGKDVIRPVSFTVLNEIAKVFVENQTYVVEIQGHTDNVGNKDMNQRLSESRANAVRTYLISKGVAEKRLTAKGFGDGVPVADNKTAAGRAKNRRVEFIVTFEEVTIEKVENIENK